MDLRVLFGVIFIGLITSTTAWSSEICSVQSASPYEYYAAIGGSYEQGSATETRGNGADREFVCATITVPIDGELFGPYTQCGAPGKYWKVKMGEKLEGAFESRDEAHVHLGMLLGQGLCTQAE